MTGPLKKISLFCLLVLAPAASGTAIEDYRPQMKSPPYKVFDTLLKTWQAKNYDGIKTVADTFLPPFYAEIKKSYNVDLEAELDAAVQSKDERKTLASIQRQIFYDIKALFDLSVEQTDSGRAVGLLKTAYLNYDLMSPAVQKADFSADQMARKMFQQAYYVAGSNSPYNNDSDPAEARKKGLKEITSRIESLLIKTLPALAS
ncbi:MAG TPA: hypothetical protein VM658_15750 [bacterium]|nr:hypothetical protein [bacterium]